jgi:proton-dependent oligopeptide transporter, POT family
MQTAKQPAALKVFFMTEMWERFSYYALQSLLVLYMQSILHFSDTQAYLLFGTLGALLYITPVVGGFVADKYIGYKNAVMIGGVALAIGYFLLAVDGRHSFFLSLALLVAGNGFFKPNVSAAVGDLYGPDDHRRDNGFTIFYMGINVGSLIGILLCGLIQNKFGFYPSFFVAAISLVLGVVVFYQGLKRFPTINQKISRPMTLIKLITIIVSTIACVAVTTLLLRHPDTTNVLLILVATLLIAYIFTFGMRYDKLTRRRLLVCIILSTFGIVFFALYMQMPMTITLFVNRLVDRHIFGFTIPTSSYWALNGIAIITLTPIMIKVWQFFDNRGREIHIPLKFVIGIVLMGAGFLELVAAMKLTAPGHLISSWWLVLSYYTQTAGELALSAIGLAMIAKLSPSEMRGMLMGGWFLSISAATAIAGNIAGFASVPKTVTAKHAVEGIYTHAFLGYGLVSIAIALVLLVFAGKLERMTLAKSK